MRNLMSFNIPSLSLIGGRSVTAGRAGDFPLSGPLCQCCQKYTFNVETRPYLIHIQRLYGKRRSIARRDIVISPSLDPMPSIVTYAIIAVTVITSLRAFSDARLQHRMLFNPYIISREKDYLRFLTAGFIHADWLHLLVNMYVLYAFGELVEFKFNAAFGRFGGLAYLALYTIGIVASHTITYFRHRDDAYYNSLGASGAVSAVLFSAILFVPTQKIYFLFLPGLGIPAWIFGLLYLFYCQYMSKRSADRINHDAHFAGAVFGLLFTGLLQPHLFTAFIQQVLP